MTRYIDTSVEKALSNAYLEYAASTFNRAIPSSVDGLKISQRRIVQSAYEMGLNTSIFKKVTKLEGIVLGNLHPNGGAAGTIINMFDASNWLNPYLQGHGNLGGWSVDTRQKISGDNPSAARYLEVKFSQLGISIFDVPVKHLSTRPNYDGTMSEIVEYVPALPTALLNAQSGIGVGFATNTISFSAKNVVKAIKNISDPTKAIKSLGVPDFAHNTNVLLDEELVRLHEEGKASITLQGEWTIDTKYSYKKRSTREAIIVTKLASTNAEKFLDQIKQAIESGKIDGIADLIDLTSKNINVHIICKAKVKAEEVLSKLIKYTDLQSKYSVNNTFVHDGIPQVLTPIQLLNIWYESRTNVLMQKYTYEKTQVEKELHVKDGILGLYNHLRDIALLIMEQDSVDQAKTEIVRLYSVSDQIAEAILNIQLKALTKISKESLQNQVSSLQKELDILNNLLTNKDALNSKIVELANLCIQHCSGRVSEVIKQKVKAFAPKVVKETTVKKEKQLISTRMLNKLSKQFFDKSNEWSYCSNMAEVQEAFIQGRHPLDDLADQELKARIAKAKNKRSKGNKPVPELKRSVIKRCNNKGILTSARLKEHLDYWAKK